MGLCFIGFNQGRYAIELCVAENEAVKDRLAVFTMTHAEIDLKSMFFCFF